MPTSSIYPKIFTRVLPAGWHGAGSVAAQAFASDRISQDGYEPRIMYSHLVKYPDEETRQWRLPIAAYDEAYERSRHAMDSALLVMGRTVPRPSVVRTAMGEAYRYKDQSPQQALVLKCVRMLSALKALRALLAEGLVLDAGSMMRISDEVGSDIMFIAGPILFNHPPEARHKQFLQELFQEEFGPRGPLPSRIKRDRVSRRHIRAYIARTFSAADSDTSAVVAVTELIEGVFSGFIHGAGAHIMDSFDGVGFHTELSQSSHQLAAMKEQFSHYIQRTIMGFCFGAKAMGREDVFQVLYKLNGELFDEHGELLRPTAARR